MDDSNPVLNTGPDKDYWHLYHLQQLSPSRFSSVVGRILDGQYGLVGSTEGRRVRLWPAPTGNDPR